MFTGIVQTTGRVVAVTETAGGQRLEIDAADLPGPLERGGSVAVAGVCLTLVETPQAGRLKFDAVTETLSKTTLGDLREGSAVNLERALLANEPLGGHTVQGHVDGVVSVVSVQADPADWRLRVTLPEAMRRWVIAKGSVTLDGVSLTVASLFEDGFDVALIPETLTKTTLDAAQPGDGINFEADAMVKTVVATVERMTATVAGGSARGVDRGLLEEAGFLAPSDGA